MEDIKNEDQYNIALPPFLLGIDLEDNERNYGIKGKTRFKYASELLLDFLDEHNIKTTFFILGESARENKNIIRRIISSNHEIGCHTNDHTPLDRLNPKSLYKNLKKNKEILFDLGAKDIYGFRAPTFSLTKKSKWVYEILYELGFKYSSSIMPSKFGVQYGWKDFGYHPRKVYGLWELPISIHKIGFIDIPLGGFYLRLLPIFLLRLLNRSEALTSYIHPYDFDYLAPLKRLKSNYILNYLLYYGRKSTLSKIKLLSKKHSYMKYIDYIEVLENKKLSI